MPGRPRVFVTRRIPNAGLAPIQDACDVDLWPGDLPPPAAELRHRVSESDGLVSLLTDRIDASLLDTAPHLRVISNFAVGYNNVDIAAATARDIPVGNTPNVLTDATADMALCLLISAARCLTEARDYALAGRWKTWEPMGHRGQDLFGKTLGVIGMGRIGYALARRCHRGWKMSVLYHDLDRRPNAERNLNARRVELDTLLVQADFISLHTDLNEHTHHLIGREQLARMKSSAVLVNTARGPLVDQAALIEALTTHRIFAAGIDVTDPEPPAPDDPIFRIPNLIVAPHIASATFGTRDAMARICAANLLAGLRGERLPECVNPEVYERPQLSRPR
jgi:glyoxylate reductase